MAAPEPLNATSLTTTRNNIQYWMLHGDGTAYKEIFKPDGCTSSFTIAVAWDSSSDWVVAMLGDNYRSGGLIRRYIPQAHPFFPSYYCVSCELSKGVGAMGSDPDVSGALHYDYAIYECHFSPLEYVVLSDAATDAITPTLELNRFVKKESKSKGEQIQAAGGFKFGDGTPVSTPPTVAAGYREVLYTHMYVPDSIATIEKTADNYYSTVNLTEFDGQYAVGTLLYLGITNKQRIPYTPSGNVCYHLQHSFMFRRQTWQMTYKPNTGAPPGDWAPVYNITTGAPPYASNEFLDLFNN